MGKNESIGMKENLLAIESAGAICGAALWIENICVIERNVPTSHGHAIELAPLLADIVRQASFPLSRLDKIAVTIGPGGFTGIRAGLAMARGLGLGLGRAIIGIDSFQRLAVSAHLSGKTLSARNLIVLDSRREELFAALLDRGFDFLSPPFLTRDPAKAAYDAEAACVITDHPAYAAWGLKTAPIIAQQPRAAALGEIVSNWPNFSPLPPLPQYLREADATPLKQKRESRAQP